MRSVTDVTDVTNNDRLSIEVHICARTWAYMGLSVTVGHSVTKRLCPFDGRPASSTALRPPAPPCSAPPSQVEHKLAEVRS